MSRSYENEILILKAYRFIFYFLSKLEDIRKTFSSFKLSGLGLHCALTSAIVFIPCSSKYVVLSPPCNISTAPLTSIANKDARNVGQMFWASPPPSKGEKKEKEIRNWVAERSLWWRLLPRRFCFISRPWCLPRQVPLRSCPFS